jgi:putative ABC transport system ATP-binding protein
MKPAVTATRVDKSFTNGTTVTPVLKQVEFTAFEGEMMFLVGPSGCGKTTLLSILCGTLAADRGEIEVHGQRLDQTREPALSRFRARHIGFIFQQFNLIPTLDLTMNVAVPLIICGTALRTAKKQARELLHTVGLGDKYDDLPARLSGGQQQRVAIARALVHAPDLIICDEPTSALDSKTGHQVLELLKKTAADARRTVIVVTHDHRIYPYADRMAEMEDGRIVRVLRNREEIAAAHPL